MAKRVFLTVLDSFGIGGAPDAAEFGDEGSNTLGSIAKSELFCAPNLGKLGLFNIDGVDCKRGVREPEGAYARIIERSKGKDTTIGHWEIAGIVSERALPTYPDGFPDEVIKEFERLTGRGVLCNKPYSGTELLRDYGEEHLKTGDLLIYTSADSVFQIAAHEDIVPVEKLYEYCQIARDMLCGEHAVGRVIARPFIGKDKDSFARTPRRHDFSLRPPKKTLLDCLVESGLDTIGVGKIYDIFAGRGVSEKIATSCNRDGQAATLELLDRDFHGLAFINLVDTDMLFGHRNDVDGYAKSISEFDDSLSDMLKKLCKDDLFIITADHGCDPGTESTDHSRECVPLLICGEPVKQGVNLGTRHGFCDIAKTVAEYLGADADFDGESFLSEILK